MGIIPGLLAGGAAAALFLGRSEYEKDCLVTDTYEICSPKLTELAKASAETYRRLLTLKKAAL